MKKFRLFLTLLFLLSAVAIIVVTALAEPAVFSRAADLVKSHTAAALIATLVFLGLLSAAMVSSQGEASGSFFNSGFFQLAVLELFLISAGLAYYGYYLQKPGQIILKLQPEKRGERINLGLTFRSAESTRIDTVQAPGKFLNKPPGHYHIETLDPEIVSFQADIRLKPGQIETLIIPAVPNAKTLKLQTEPPGAAIRINGLQASHTPSAFKVLSGDTVLLELKMEGYQVYRDTLILTEDVDLGTIVLQKLYSLRIAARYPDIGFIIYDQDGQVVSSGRGSRTLHLAAGRYRISFEIGEGQYETKRIELNRNSGVSLP